MKLALLIIFKHEIDIENKFPPLGLGYIASYLNKYNPDVEAIIIDNDHLKELRAFKPDMIGISSITPYFKESVKLARLIRKEFDVPLFLGGYHISMNPKSLLKTCFDFAVLGEGEETINEIVTLFKKGKIDKGLLKMIKGVAFADKGLVITPPREMITPLDKIPFPARELYREIGKDRTAHIITSRGCPYKCVFCSSSSFWKSVRFHSPKYVVDEIEELVNRYKIKHINIADDLFIASRKRVYDILSLIKKRNIKATFSVRGRADLMDDSLCKALKEMGVISINFGFESGSPRMLKYLKKDTVSVEQNMKAIDMCKRHGFMVVGSFIIGSPGETKEDMLMSLDFVRKSRLDGGDTYVAVPLPGTILWDYALKKGFVSDDMDWDRLNFNPDEIGKNIILADKVTKKELYGIFGMFQREWSKKRVASMMRNMFSLTYVKRALFNPFKAIRFCYKTIADNVGRAVR